MFCELVASVSPVHLIPVFKSVHGKDMIRYILLQKMVELRNRICRSLDVPRGPERSLISLSPLHRPHQRMPQDSQSWARPTYSGFRVNGTGIQ